MSFKYSLLKGAFRLINAQRIMAQEPEALQRMFRRRNQQPAIPRLSDPELDIETEYLQDQPVLYIRHRQPCSTVIVYVVGGGMLKYPTPGQARGLLSLARETGRDVVLPYYPLCYDHVLSDVFAMLYALYKELLTAYPAENILFLGGSSGGFHTLALMSYINAQGEGLSLPGKLYLASPGSMFPTEADRARASDKDQTDLIMSVRAMDNIWHCMTHGQPVPDYMAYLQCGDYTGLRDVYMSYGGDEIFSASAEAIRTRLEQYDVHVTLEIAKGMYHCYAAMPLVPEATQGYQNMIDYCKVP